jgi:plastocyanin
MGRLLLVIPVLVVALAIPATSSGTHRDPKTFTIKVGDDFFSPTKKTVHIRDIVKWTWVDAEGKRGETVNEHTVVEKTGEKLPKLNSGQRTSGSYRFRFKKAGRFTIICADHPETMVLRIRVTK